MEGTQGAGLEIQQEERGSAGAFFIDGEGRRLAELTYTRRGPGAVVLVHTEVSSALQGRGVARKLVDQAVAWARRTGTKLIPECTYARSVFDRNPDLHDVLR
jgi:predicted GNAT family acetyltransferase